MNSGSGYLIFVIGTAIFFGISTEVSAVGLPCLLNNYVNYTGRLFAFGKQFLAARDIQFELYTRSNQLQPSCLSYNDASTFQNSNFNRSNPTRIFIHGWISPGELTPAFSKAYFVHGNHNVNFIAVNWQEGSTELNYTVARERVPSVGVHVAKFVDFMNEMKLIDISDLSIIGHSLGAHIAGIVGKNVQSGKVGKIVGLDPAATHFSYEDVDGRLDKTDASYVETMHTCIEILGFTLPIGHVSFYPNGGKFQPGCWDLFGICSHYRTVQFYIESINNPQFLAFKCDSLESVRNGTCLSTGEPRQMASEPGPKSGSGIFYLETNPQRPFAKGSSGLSPTYSHLRIWNAPYTLVHKAIQFNDKNINTFANIARKVLAYSKSYLKF